MINTVLINILFVIRELVNFKIKTSSFPVPTFVGCQYALESCRVGKSVEFVPPITYKLFWLSTAIANPLSIKLPP